MVPDDDDIQVDDVGPEGGIKESTDKFEENSELGSREQSSSGTVSTGPGGSPTPPLTEKEVLNLLDQHDSIIVAWNTTQKPEIFKKSIGTFASQLQNIQAKVSSSGFKGTVVAQKADGERIELVMHNGTLYPKNQVPISTQQTMGIKNNQQQQKPASSPANKITAEAPTNPPYRVELETGDIEKAETLFGAIFRAFGNWSMYPLVGLATRVGIIGINSFIKMPFHAGAYASYKVASWSAGLVGLTEKSKYYNEKAIGKDGKGGAFNDMIECDGGIAGIASLVRFPFSLAFGAKGAALTDLANARHRFSTFLPVQALLQVLPGNFGDRAEAFMYRRAAGGIKDEKLKQQYIDSAEYLENKVRDNRANWLIPNTRNPNGQAGRDLDFVMRKGFLEERPIKGDPQGRKEWVCTSQMAHKYMSSQKVQNVSNAPGSMAVLGRANNLDNATRNLQSKLEKYEIAKEAGENSPSATKAWKDLNTAHIKFGDEYKKFNDVVSRNAEVETAAVQDVRAKALEIEQKARPHIPSSTFTALVAPKLEPDHVAEQHKSGPTVNAKVSPENTFENVISIENDPDSQSVTGTIVNTESSNKNFSAGNRNGFIQAILHLRERFNQLLGRKSDKVENSGEQQDRQLAGRFSNLAQGLGKGVHASQNMQESQPIITGTTTTPTITLQEAPKETQKRTKM